MVWYMLPLELQAPPINHAACARRGFEDQRTLPDLMVWWRGGHCLNIKAKWAVFSAKRAVADIPCLSFPFFPGKRYLVYIEQNQKL